jgi:hypothetical protein
MRIRRRNRNADIAAPTVHKVLAQPFTQPTKPTVIAVIDALVAVVVPQLALVAVVPRSILAALHARLSGGLRRLAQHAEHVLRLLAVQVVGEGQVVGGIVAVSAGVPLSAVEALNLDVAFVVHAAQVGECVLLFHAIVSVGRVRRQRAVVHV